MITIDYVYKNKMGTWKNASKTFDSINKAVRFIYVIMDSQNMVYDGFTCTSYEETNEMLRRL